MTEKQTENAISDGSVPLQGEAAASWVVDQWILTLQKTKLNSHELVLAISSLLYSIGASLEGFTGVGPTPSEVLKEYYTDPKRLGVAMMAQALQMNQTWLETLDQVIKESDKPV